jgi:thiol-disulfide isomerase/thioredoxin
MDKTIRTVAIALAVVLLGVAVFLAVPGILSHSPPASTTAPVSGTVTVYFFYGEECPHCHEIMPFMDNLTAKYPDVNFRKLETWHNQTNQKLADSMNSRLGVKEAGVPEVIVGDTVLIGSRDIPVKLEAVVLEQKKK